LRFINPGRLGARTWHFGQLHQLLDKHSFVIPAANHVRLILSISSPSYTGRKIADHQACPSISGGSEHPLKAYFDHITKMEKIYQILWIKNFKSSIKRAS
jgi:hypothetical protein